MELQALAGARERLSAPLPHSGSERVESGELFFEMSVPAQELVVFGAGPDAAPLAQHAWALGFSVTLVDVRGAYLTQDRFPTATLVNAHFSAFATAVPLPPAS